MAKKAKMTRKRAAQSDTAGGASETTATAQHEETTKFSMAQASMWMFVAFTVMQIVSFVFAPTIYASQAPELGGPPFAFFRLIGVMEVGLMAFYSCATAINDTGVFWLTVFGRMMVIPYMLSVVLFFEGPYTILLGIFQDIAGAFITRAYLIEEEANGTQGKKILFPGTRFMRLASTSVRATIFIVGCLDIYYGAGLYLQPLTFLEPEKPLVNIQSSIGPTHLGFRSFGFMTTLLGVYQLFLAARARPLCLYLAFGAHHLFLNFMANGGLQKYVDPNLIGEEISMPAYHFYLGTSLLLQAVW